MMFLKRFFLAAAISFATLFSLLLPLRAYGNELDTNSYPLLLGPTQLVNDLNEPLRSINLTMAASLAETQALLLLQSNDASLDPLDNYVLGIAFAAEEYFLRELTFPDSVDDFTESGILLPGWKELGISLVDFDNHKNDSCNLEIVYIPQPIGLVDLICVPKHPCTTKMRCYTEYSLAVNSECMAKVFENPPKIRTGWFKPFYQNGISEILHINQKNKAKSSLCASCNSH